VPTVLRNGPYRFYFYSGDRDEPPHVHVERDDEEAKIWLRPVRLAWSRGFSPSELSKMEGIVRENQQQLLESWNGFFGD